MGLSRIERIAKEDIRSLELPSQTPSLFVIAINKFPPISDY